MGRKTLGLNVNDQELRLIADVRHAQRYDHVSDLLREIVLPAIRRRHRKLFGNGGAGKKAHAR